MLLRLWLLICPSAFFSLLLLHRVHLLPTSVGGPTAVIKHQLTHLQRRINEAQHPAAGATGCNHPAGLRRDNAPPLKSAPHQSRVTSSDFSVNKLFDRLFVVWLHFFLLWRSVISCASVRWMLMLLMMQTSNRTQTEFILKTRQNNKSLTGGVCSLFSELLHRAPLQGGSVRLKKKQYE